MTVGGWIGFGVVALCILGLAITIACTAENNTVTVISLIAAFALIFGTFAGFKWFYKNTATGQRAVKTQESNFNGGLNRVVEVYSYDGDLIKSWEGEFDVTENDQETYFDIDGRRVIIQGGIIINEEIDTD